MKTWEIQLNHDNYQTTLIMNATDEDTARSLIMKMENCPARSILSIKEV
jgi:predicted transcriptional regulator